MIAFSYFQWEDPYYEAFGKHFADLIERHCVPVIVLNLMKQQEKRPFEKQLTAGFLEGIEHLNQVSLNKSRNNENNETKITTTQSKYTFRPSIYIHVLDQ